MKPIEQIALKLAAKLGWVPGHDDLADEVIGNIAAAIRARDAEWREAVEALEAITTACPPYGNGLGGISSERAEAYRHCERIAAEALKQIGETP